MPKLTAYGYCRVSTQRQEREGLSLGVQEDMIRSFCRFRQFDLAEIFVEGGASGTTLDRRPKFERTLEKVTKAKGVLVICDISRFARNSHDAQGVYRRIEQAGAHLASVTEPFDTTASGKLMFDILAAIAAFDSRQKGEKIAAAIAASRRERGFLVTGRQPPGYRLDDNHNRYVCEEEVAIMRRVNRMRRDGCQLKYISATLNAEGVPTIGSLRGLVSAKPQWTWRIVQQLLKSKVPNIRKQAAG